MKLTFRKHEVKDLSHLQGLVADNPEAVEPGFRVLSATVNFGRSTVELVGVDRRETPALIALGFTGDDTMLFRMVEAYAWSLEYPDSVRRLMPGGDSAGGWPPRVVFIAERLPESFLRKVRLLAFPAVDCFEFRCVEVNDTTGFYLDPVDWAATDPGQTAPGATASASPVHSVDFRREVPPATPRPVADHAESGAEHTQPSRWFGLRGTQASDGSSKRSPAWAAPSSPPVADTPATTEPARELLPQAPPPADDANLDDDHELTPAWRKLLEKLAGTFDTHHADARPAAATGTPSSLAPGFEFERVAPNGHASPPRNGAMGRHDDAMRRALLDVLKLPANGELVPQWRKFLETTAIDETKIGAVRDYLHREFPMCTIYDFFDYQQNAQVLQLHDAQGKVCHSATIVFEFFDAHRDSELRAVLDTLRLSYAMRQAGQAAVVVTPEGLEVQKR